MKNIIKIDKTKLRKEIVKYIPVVPRELDKFLDKHTLKEEPRMSVDEIIKTWKKVPDTHTVEDHYHCCHEEGTCYPEQDKAKEEPPKYFCTVCGTAYPNKCGCLDNTTQAPRNATLPTKANPLPEKLENSRYTSRFDQTNKINEIISYLEKDKPKYDF